MITTSHLTTSLSKVIGWFFGLLVMAIGIINMFWGNDPQFGIFIFLLAFVFLPPANTYFQKISGFSIPRVAKWLLGLFILIAALGVGELFQKIDLMLMSF
ncbi:hypothetical protein ACFSC6_14035 [Rufibacter sediminis]|uniref:Uncharacterized protein n=1 Tax=Rufibacter sediminis TaxID=2762756 RepID=A0ABR6VYK4_9BACT|nr:hypothetical protein [Rufibacter sediminis]MBC3542313.1 hypothetical protein [Rufibacter sediminis]